MRTLHLDWTGHPKLDRPADFYSVASNATLPPKATWGNPAARLLIAFSTTTHYTPEGLLVPEPFNAAVYNIADLAGALVDEVLGVEPNGFFTKPVDITKRGIVAPLTDLLLNTFPHADGFHWDLMTPLGADAGAWERTMAGMANILRSRGRLVVGQQYHPTPASMACNGQWWEQTPTSFGYTMEHHTFDLNMFKGLIKWADPQREVLFVAEIRDYTTLPKWYLDQVKAWAQDNNIVLSWGRNETAGIIP